MRRAAIANTQPAQPFRKTFRISLRLHRRAGGVRIASTACSFQEGLMLRSLFFAALLAIPTVLPQSQTMSAGRAHHQIIVPQEDRFTPYSIIIGVGDTVQWINMDTDDHTVVSDDFFDTAGHKGVNHLLPGTDSNGG